MISLKTIVSFLLSNSIVPSKICLAMAEHYRAIAIEANYVRPRPATSIARWSEIAKACDSAAEIFLKISI